MSHVGICSVASGVCGAREPGTTHTPADEGSDASEGVLVLADESGYVLGVTTTCQGWFSNLACLEDPDVLDHLSSYQPHASAFARVDRDMVVGGTEATPCKQGRVELLEGILEQR